jgi:hypothetical protein
MSSLRTLARGASLGLLVLAAGRCSSSKTGTSSSTGSTSSGTGGSTTCPTLPTPPADAAPLLKAACDPLVPTHCGFPFPTNVYTKADTTTPTKLRVAVPQEAMPHASTVGRLNPAMVADADGFSPGGTILTSLPGATVTGLPTQDTLPASVTTMSPTILLNAVTGELVPHWSELDDELPSEDATSQTFMIRPVVRLADATRYIVAIRHVVDMNGKALAPSPVFQALRDGTTSCDPSVAARTSLYADIFAKLKAAGIAQDDLQLAWDFTTASQANNTQWMIAMRDDALMKFDATKYTLFPPAAAGTCKADTDCTSPQKCMNGTCLDATTSTSCNNLTASTVNATETNKTLPSEIGSLNCSQDSPNPHIWRRLFGLMTVPLYMTSPNPMNGAVPSGINLGSNNMPAQNGVAEYEFEVNIPMSATTKGPASPLANAHGLLGDKTEGDNSYLAQIDDAGNFASIAVDFIGFDQDDYNTVSNSIATDPTQLKAIMSRQHQGMINQLLAMRLMNQLAKDPLTQFNGKATIDPTNHYYRGDSQGGIFGATYMAVSTDVTRGVLGEPGAPYSLLLNRSQDFAPFFLILTATFNTGANMQTFLHMLQMSWDRTEPDGYIPYITSNMLAGTPAHNVLIHANVGDYQVTPLGAELIARAVGATQLSPVNREIYGIKDSPGPIATSAIVEWSWGLQPAPETNVPPQNLCPANPPPHCGDPHDQLRIQQSSIQQEVTFFTTGMVVQTCGTGPCIGTFM